MNGEQPYEIRVWYDSDNSTTFPWRWIVNYAAEDYTRRVNYGTTQTRWGSVSSAKSAVRKHKRQMRKNAKHGSASPITIKLR